MKAISVKLPDPLFHDLVQRARSSSASQSDIVRTALEAYLKNDAQAPAASCSERARRWNGLVEGTRDLATNPDHLLGLGR